MRKSPLSGLSWLQLIAGALAAMTSAWVASYLGVAGTIIGAAVGSLVASVASALYVRGLDRSTTLITQGGSVVTRARAADDPEEESDVVVADAADEIVEEEPARDFPWKRVLGWTAAGLVTALVLIGGYELVTQSSFGNADSPTISRPFRDGDDSPRRETPAPESEATTAPTDDPTTAPTTAAPTTAPTTAPPTTDAPTEAPAPQSEPTEPPADGQ